MKTDYKALKLAAGTTPVDSRLGAAIPLGKLARCPFHEDDTPSFGPYTRDGLVRWKCQGAVCGWEGDAIDFVMKYDKVERDEAVQRIDGKVAGPVLGQKTVVKAHTFGWDMQRVKRAFEALPGNKAVLEFITKRGVSMDTAKALKFGCEGSYLVMPTFDEAGALCAVKLRHPKPTGDTPKWLKKSRDENVYHLFNRAAVSGLGDVLVTESELDAAMLSSHGFEAVSVDSANHKLTKEDADLLRGAPRVVLATDADGSGETCATALKKDIGAKRCLRVTPLGFKDFGELYAATPEKFAEQVKRLTRLSETTRPDFTFDDLRTEVELMEEQGVEIKYAIDKLVPLRRITMLYGQEKSCKSLLSFYYAKCAANGVKVFGHYDSMKMPSIYLDAEDGVLGNYIGWMHKIGKEQVRFRTLGTGIPALADPYLLEICKKHQPLLVVDSLHKFTSKDVKTNAWKSDDMEPVLQKLRDLCTAGATVILIHHATKGDPTIYRDSSVIGAGVDFLFALVGEDVAGGVKHVRLLGQPSRGAQPPSLLLKAFPCLIEQGTFELEDRPPETPGDIIVRFVRDNDGATERDVREKVKGMANKKKDDALKLAVEQGRLIKNSKGVYSAPHIAAQVIQSLSAPDAGRMSGAEPQEIPFV